MAEERGVWQCTCLPINGAQQNHITTVRTAIAMQPPLGHNSNSCQLPTWEHINHGPSPCTAAMTVLRPWREMSAREPNHHPLGEKSTAMLQEALTATIQLQGCQPTLAAAAPSFPLIWETPVKDVGDRDTFRHAKRIREFYFLASTRRGCRARIEILLAACNCSHYCRLGIFVSSFLPGATGYRRQT